MNFTKHHNNSVKTNRKAFDLFSGAGGFSLAAIEAKMRVVGAIENDRHACATYSDNILAKQKSPRPKLFDSDILALDPQEVRQAVELERGELDIMLGGPPCQGFSSHRLKDSGVDDPRNKLLLRYFDFVEEFMPKAFLVENVPGLLWDKHKPYLEKFYEIAGKRGYDVLRPVQINAKDFGLPQHRKRVFILGFRELRPKDLVWPPKPTHFDPRLAAESGLRPWNPAKSVFDVPPPEEDPNSIHMVPGEQMIIRFRDTPKNGGSRFQSGHTLPCHENHIGHKDVYGRIDPNKPSPTMTTGCTNPSKGRFVHPVENHGITIRQAARFQSFPDDFVFHGGLGAAGKQIGNAVPVALGKFLLNHLFHYL